MDELRNSGKILDVCPTMADFRERYGDKVGSEVLNEFRKYYNRLRRGVFIRSGFIYNSAG